MEYRTHVHFSEEARDNYLANYSEGWTGLGTINEVTKNEFKKWIESSHRKTKPFADYKNVKVEGAQNEAVEGVVTPAEPVTPLKDEEVAAVIDAMKAHATVAPSVEINDANWKENVDTPIGTVKMGENQKAKLFDNGREQQYGMLLETLSNPDIVLEEQDKERNMFHERPSSYLFVKTFQKEDGSKHVHFESVTVSQEGMEVSVSSHIIRENQLKNKVKNDRLLYKATALDAPAITSAEQPIEGGSLSSGGKVTNNSASDQENGVKSYKISTFEYTTKRGKKPNMQLVTFESELSKEQMNAAKKLAKDLKGWWSKDDGGFDELNERYHGKPYSIMKFCTTGTKMSREELQDASLMLRKKKVVLSVGIS